ncbi:MAG: energy-coupling factor transporter ATPase [Lachnospiraceae bacterium]|nr:energy-coupling factor transporter ATPase [Lachnospiraceae bacterium]
MKLIKTQGLFHRFNKYDENGDPAGQIAALEGVDMEIGEGEFIAILGHNGCGKSTLAKHFNALLSPTQGAVYVEGKDTREEENLRQIRSTAGMVFQNPDNQMVSSVIEEDVAFGPENLSVPTEEIELRVTSCLEKLGMSAYRYHAPTKLSGGQKQRIAIAGVMAMEPKCIILDEATAMLDPAGRRDVLEAIRDLNRAGITIILITHYMEETVNADKIFVMNDGKVIMSGTPREIFARREELEAAGLRLPDVTRLGYELKEGGMDISVPVLSEKELIEAIVRTM